MLLLSLIYTYLEYLLYAVVACSSLSVVNTFYRFDALCLSLHFEYMVPVAFIKENVNDLCL